MSILKNETLGKRWPTCHQMPIFHCWKQCKKKKKGLAQNKTAQSCPCNSEARCNWINPVLPNCTIWYLKICYFSPQRNFCVIFLIGRSHQHFRIWMNKIMGTEKTNYLEVMRFEWKQKAKTRLLFTVQFLITLFSLKVVLGKKMYLAYMPTKRHITL